MSEIQTPHLDIPAAWRGRELLERADWVRDLGPNELQELIEAAPLFTEDENGKGLVRGRPLEGCGKDDSVLPVLARTLRQIQIDLEEGSGACMLRGFPIEHLDASQARGLFWAMACHVGTPVSQSASGERIFSVRDAGYSTGDPRSRGPNTRKKLSFHTDRCDVIGFLCVNQAMRGGENEVVSSVSVYNEIRRRRPDLLKVLMRPFYYQRHSVDLGNERPYCSQPIFSIHQGHFAANFLRVLIERAHDASEVPPMTPLQKEALDLLEEVAGEPDIHVRFAQTPGDILFLNNWVTLHRRTEFEDFEEPNRKRCLFRIWLSVSNSRPLDPMFQANYGAVAAGALRGGMKKA